MAPLSALALVWKHFNTGFIDEYDFTVMDRKKVRHMYLSGWSDRCTPHYVCVLVLTSFTVYMLFPGFSQI